MKKLFFITVLLLNVIHASGQSCDASVPVFTADLTGNPDSVWTSPSIQRNGKCCGVSGSNKCVSFNITLDSASQAVRFNIASGAVPGGSLTWQLNCGGSNSVNDEICISGPGPHLITFCKPGNNTNTYSITAISEPAISPTTAANESCTGILFATGYDPATISWRSVTDPSYDALLSCSSGCDTTVVTAPNPLVPFVDYEVTGTPQGGCTSVTVKDTARVFFYDNFVANITPNEPTVCFGDVTTNITANASGGKPPYSYSWSNGDTVASIDVSLGKYIVQVADSFNCVIITDSVTVTANPLPVASDAGEDTISCANNPDVTLNGSVQIATGGQWTNGAGTYNPNDTTLNADYTPSAGEITAGFTELILTTTGNSGCPSVNDTVNITIQPTPIVSAGPDQSVCANNPRVTLAGSISNAGGGTWTGGNGVYFPNANTLNALYTPSAAEITAGSVNLTLTSTGNGTCIPVTDQITITITPAPTVDAGLDQTVCANNSNITLAGSFSTSSGARWLNGGGTYSPDNITMNAIYTPSSGERSGGSARLILESTGNGTCNPVYDTVDFTITPAPTVNAGADQTVCANNSDVTLDGSFTIASGAIWSNGTGTYNPDNTTMNATYSPSGSEVSDTTATLVLTSTGNGNCLAVSDSMTITITEEPTANAGPDLTVCSNNPIITLSGSVTVATDGNWSGGNGTLIPIGSTLGATYAPSLGEILSGSVTLDFTTAGSGDCFEVSDQIVISFSNAPSADAGPDQTVCANNPDVTLSGTVTVSTGGEWRDGSGTYNPDNATLNTVYTPSLSERTSGSADLTLYSTGNGNCNQVTDDITITITPAPTINAGANQTKCSNNAATNLNASFTVASGMTWSGGLGTFSPNSTTANATYTPTAAEISSGSITLTATTSGSGTCNEVSDDMTITFTPAPTANAGPDKFVCANKSAISLTGTVTVATGGNWVGSGGTFNPGSTSLNTIYTPSAGEIAANVGVLILQTTGNGTCNAVGDTLIVIISDSQTVDAGPAQNICQNNTNIILSGTSTNTNSTVWSGGSGSYSPNNAALNPTYTPTAGEVSSGSLTLTLTGLRATCNDVTDQVTFTFTPSPIVEAGPNQTVCANNATTSLNGSVSTATGGIWTGNGTFSPNNTSLTASYTPTAAEISTGSAKLYLTSTGNGNCTAVTDSMTITITPAPTVDAGIDQTVCANNNTVTLNGSVTIATGGTWSGLASSYTPNINTLNATFIPTAAQISAGTATLTLTSTGNGNCTPVTDNMVITITPAPIVNAGPNQSVCEDNPNTTINGSITVATGGVWTGGNGIYSPNQFTNNITYTPSLGEISAGTASLTLTSTGNGICNAESDAMVITITKAPTVNAGPDQSVCGNVSNVNLNGAVTIASGGTWTNSGTGGFNNANALNAIYNPSAADIAGDTVTLTLTTTGNGNCNAYTDDLLIIFSPVPVANAGPDQTICTNDLPIQLAASGTASTWSGGSGTFSPDNTTLNAIYTPSAGEITAGTVTLTQTTNVNGSCSAVSDAVTITIPTGPVANAGSNDTICADNSTYSLNGSILNATGGNWTTNGSGSFSPSSSTLNATYNITVADTSLGTLTFVLTSTGNGACTADIDTMLLTITPEVKVSAGVDQTFCANIDSIALNGSVITAAGARWTTSGSGNFSPNDSTLSASYIPTNADTTSGTITLTLTSYGNGLCGADSDNMNIIFTPEPYVSAGPNDTICADNSSYTLIGSVNNASGGIWTTSGSGSFNPNDVSLNANYNLTAADTTNGIVEFYLSSTGNGICSSITDTSLLLIDPQPIVNAGPDQSVCADLDSINLSGIVTHATGGVWSSSGTGSFNNANDLNAKYAISSSDSAGGLIVFTLTTTGNGLCNPVTDQVVYTFTPAPTSNAGPNQTVCANSTSIALNGSVTVATGGRWESLGSGTFSDSLALSTTYAPSINDTTAGSVTLTLTTTGNGTCQAVTDTIVISFDPVPIVNAGSDQTICADSTYINLAGTVTNAAGGIWSSSSSGTFSPNNVLLATAYNISSTDSSNGSVTLFLTSTGNNTCNPVTDDLQITITPVPTSDAGPDQSVCSNVNSSALTGVVTIATGGIWTSTGSGTFTDSSNLNTSYFPTAADTAAGNIILRLTTTGNGNCKAVTDQMNMTFVSEPIVSAGPNLAICGDQSSVTLNGNVSNAGGLSWSSSGTGTFTPDTTSTNVTYNFSSADTSAHTVNIILTSTSNGVCNPAIDTVNIMIDTIPIVNVGSDQNICGSATNIQLNGTVQHATGGTWTSSGTGSFSPNNVTLNAKYIPTSADTAAGSVSLTLTSSGNGLCNPVQDQITITFQSVPVADAGSNDTICSNNSSVNLNGKIFNATGGIWSTSTGQGTFADSSNLTTSFTPSGAQKAAGTAVIRLTTTGNGVCPADDDIVIISIRPLPVVNAGPSQSICTTQPDFTVNGTVTNAGGGLWTTSGTGTFSDSTDLNSTYFYSSLDTATTITLTLTSTGNGPCPAQSDFVNYSFQTPPTVDAGPSSICTDQGGFNLNGTYTSSGGIQWSTSGTGLFSPSTTVTNPTYTPSVADQTAGNITIYLTTTGNGGCSAAIDSIAVGIVPKPTANAGPNKIVCANIGSVNINGSVTGATGGQWTSSGGGAFSPSSTSLNVNYTLSATDVSTGSVTLSLTTTGVGICNAHTDDMLITITTAPTIDAGSNQTICADRDSISVNATVNIASGGTWSTLGSGNFANPNSLSTKFAPSAADKSSGQIYLVIESTGNGTCLPVKDSLRLTITPAPTVNIGTDDTICADASGYALSASRTIATGGVWTTTGTGGFFPDSANNIVIYSLTTADTTAHDLEFYYNTTGNGQCQSVSDTLLLHIDPAPFVSAGAGSVCASSDTIPLNGSYGVASGAGWTTSGTGSFTPDTSSLNASYIPSAADKSSGQVTLYLTTTGNGLCSEVTDSIVLNISPEPTITAGIDHTICADTIGIDLDGGYTNAGGALWSSTGSGSFAVATDTHTIYTPSAADTAAGSIKLYLETTNTGLCPAIADTMNLTITPATFADAGPAIICATSNVIDLTGTFYIATDAYWSTPNGTGTFSVDSSDMTGTYTLSPADTTAGSVDIVLTTTGNGICKVKRDTVVINRAIAPTASAGPAQTVCDDRTSITLAGSITNAGGGYWSTVGNGTFNDSTNLSAQYFPTSSDTIGDSLSLYLTTTGNGICAAVVDSMKIYFTPIPTVDAGPSTVCSNNPNVNISGTVTIAAGGGWITSGTGSFGDTSSLSTTYTPSGSDISAGTVTLSLITTGNGDCQAYSDDIILNITNSPIANAGSDQNVCTNSLQAALAGNVTNATGGVWSSNGSGVFSDSTDLNAIYFPSNADTTAGVVTLTLTTTGNGGCLPVSDDLDLTIIRSPEVNAGIDQNICKSAANTNVSGSISFSPSSLWTTSGTGNFTTPGSLNTTFTPSSADTAAGSVYLILNSNGGSCPTESDSLLLTFDPIPTADAGPGSVCSDEVGFQLNGIITNASGGIWSTTGTGSFAPNNTTLNTIYVYTQADSLAGSVDLILTSTGNGSCSASSDTITLNIVPPPTINAGSDQTICANEPGVNLNGSFSGSTTAGWTTLGTGTFSDTSVTNPNYLQSANDTLNGSVNLVYITIGNGPCAAATDTMTIYYTPAPTATVNAGNDTTICANEAFVPLNGYISIAGGAEWSSSGTGTFAPSVSNLNSKYYPSLADTASPFIDLILSTTNNGSCIQVRDTMRVTINPSPITLVGPDTTYCEDIGSISLNGTIYNANGGVWTTFGTGTFSPNDSTLNAVYTPSSGDLNDSVLVLSLTSYSTGGCAENTDARTIYFNKVPESNAGFDQTICSDLDSISVNGSVKYATGGIWSTNGTGTFDSDSSLSTKYRVSSSDSSSGSIKIYLTTYGNNQCNPVIDSFTLNITPAVIVDAGPDQNICADQESIFLAGTVAVASGGIWSTSGTGTFSPSKVDLNAEYFTSNSDTSNNLVTFYLTSTGNGTCQPVMDSMDLVIDPAPSVYADTNQTICGDAGSVALNGSVMVAQGGLWTTSGTGTFSPNDSTLNANYIPSNNDINNGLVNLILTTYGNGLCNPVNDNMNVTITPIPTVNAGPNQTICADASQISLNGTVSIASGGTWSTNGSGVFTDSTSLSTDYLISSNDSLIGSITIYLTSTGNGQCNPVIDSMTLDLTTVPTVNAGSDHTICADSSAILVNGSVTTASGGQWSSSGSGNFFPSNTSLNADYIPSSSDISAGVIGLTLTTTGNGTCNSYSDFTQITITPRPTVNAGNDKTICADEIGAFMNGSVTTATGGIWSSSGTGVFTSGATTLNTQYEITANDISAGTVNLILTTTGNGTCKTYTDNMILSITPQPTVDAGSNLLSCANNSTELLNGKITIATGATWSGGSGLFSPNANTLNAEYTPTQIEIDSGYVDLILTTTGNGRCQAYSDTMRIDILPAPIVDAGSASICADIGQLAPLFGSVQNATSGVWSSSGSGIFTPTAADTTTSYQASGADIANVTVILTITSTGNGPCNAESDDINLIITDLPIPDAGNDATICRGDMTPLVANVLTNVKFEWFTTDTVLIDSGIFTNVQANTDTSFVLAVTDVKGCTVYDTVDIYAVDPPVFQLANNYCFDPLLVIDSDPVPVPTGGGYQWYTNGAIIFGEDTTTLPISAVGVYVISHEDGNCRAFDTTLVDQPIPQNADSTIFCLKTDGGVSLDAGPAVSYLWLATGATSQTEIVTSAGYHYFEIYDSNGCSTLDSIKAADICPPALFIPNAISPNLSGGENLEIFGEDFTNFEIFIYNRWGEIIFQSNDPSITWDGTFRGKKMPTGVYAYRVTYEGVIEAYKGPFELVGTVTLIY